MYELVYRVLLRRLPAETAHAAGFWLIRAAGTLPGVAWLLRRWLAPRDPVLRVRALGLDLPGPLGLAAGFDKDARGADALGALGFAFVEVGTVTARAQPGNPRPRMFRLPARPGRGEPDGLQQRGRGGRGGAPAQAAGTVGPARPARAAPGRRRGEHRQDQGRSPGRGDRGLRSQRTAGGRGGRLRGGQRQLAEHAWAAGPSGGLVVAAAAGRGPGGARRPQPGRSPAPQPEATGYRCWSRSRRIWPTATSTRSRTSRWNSAWTESSPPTPPSPGPA